MSTRFAYIIKSLGVGSEASTRLFARKSASFKRSFLNGFTLVLVVVVVVVVVIVVELACFGSRSRISSAS
mgnify:CR=1 FL=1